MCDYLSIALRNPAVMGKDTFGGKRIVRGFFYDAIPMQLLEASAPELPEGMD